VVLGWKAEENISRDFFDEGHSLGLSTWLRNGGSPLVAVPACSSGGREGRGGAERRVAGVAHRLVDTILAQVALQGDLSGGVGEKNCRSRDEIV
jgi:hypothetical protein